MPDFRQLRIVFMGTPEFAVASLRAVVEAGCCIAAVVTAPDKPAGRGLQLQQSAVRKYAVEKGLKVLQPEKLKDPHFLDALKECRADIQVVVAFRMLPELVWNMPPMGTINVHGSLLPQYRGAAPINWAIINGEKETGVTTFKLKHEIDTGNVLLQERISIGENETAGSLHERMMAVGAVLLVNTLRQLANGQLAEIAQEQLEGAVKQAPKIHTETCRINWEKSGDEIFNLVRGLSPYPAAFTEVEGKKLKIFFAEKERSESSVTPGSIVSDKKTYLKFRCADGFLSVTDLQLEGKKRMPVIEFLKGYRFTIL